VAKWSGITESELELLSALWERGPSTVRDLYESLPADRQRGYTTVLKQLQLMHQKGLLTRELRDRTHVYAPATAPEESKKGIVNEMINKLFGGSARALALNALGTEHDEKELKEIQEMLDRMDQKS
jgi:predicted transcriptional regulator